MRKAEISAFQQRSQRIPPEKAQSGGASSGHCPTRLCSDPRWSEDHRERSLTTTEKTPSDPGVLSSGTPSRGQWSKVLRSTAVQIPTRCTRRPSSKISAMMTGQTLRLVGSQGQRRATFQARNSCKDLHQSRRGRAPKERGATGLGKRNAAPVQVHNYWRKPSRHRSGTIYGSSEVRVIEPRPRLRPRRQASQEISRHQTLQGRSQS